MAKALWKKHWGLIFFAITTAVSLVQIWNEKNWLHYRIFSGAARELFAGRNPHITDYGTSMYWFYSPSCGLYFYGLFSWLPDRIGIYAYMLSSLALFLYGVSYFLKALLDRPTLRLNEPWLNLFWFWLSFEVMAAIISTKLEIVMAGLLFLVVGLIIKGRGRYLAPFLLAMMVNWKFQPIPVFGLLSLVFLISARTRVFIPLFVVSLLFWFVAPLALMSADALNMVMRAWSESLNSTISQNWREFMHVYRFMESALKIPMEYRYIFPISAVSGIAMAIATGVFTWKKSRLSGTAEALKWGSVLALALGSTFMIAFSPYGQMNAFILVSPVFLMAVVFLEEARASVDKSWEKTWRIAIACGIIVTSLLNSDAFGKTSRLFFVSLGTKPIGPIFLACVVTYALFAKLKLAKRGGSDALERS